MTFINRKKELQSLHALWNSRRSHLFILYGKRRVGKTELIKQFLKNKTGIYYLADKRSSKEQLRELGRIVGEYFDDSILVDRGFENWLECFSYLHKKVTAPFIFALDEYPYLIEVDKTIPSLFQKGWDTSLQTTPIILLLSGSSVAMMESQALVYKAPLYGRRTGQLLLKPLHFYESWKFFPHKGFDDFLNIFTITGGLPAYLLKMENTFSLKENIIKHIFEKTAFLHNEIEFILKEELREPKNYLSILRAIALGKRKFGEIVNETGLEKNVLTKYLNVLEQLQLIDKEVPVTEETLTKSRKGLYRIADNFTRFWFQYIFPYKSDLEIERHDEVLRKFDESFQYLVAQTYENVCQEITWKYEEKIFRFERIGKWWEKEKEIDLVGINAKTKDILFGEAKWSHKPVGTNVYVDLIKKAQSVQWNHGKRKEYFALFSRSGFTKDMISLSEKEKVFLIHKDTLL